MQTSPLLRAFFVLYYNFKNLHLSCDLMAVMAKNAKTCIISFIKIACIIIYDTHAWWLSHRHTSCSALGYLMNLFKLHDPDSCFWGLKSKKDSLFLPVFVPRCHVPVHWCIRIHLTVTSDTAIHNPLLGEGFESCCGTGLVSIQPLPHI